MNPQKIFLVAAFVIAGCSPKTHVHFGSTKYVTDIYTYAINDSLRLSLKTFGDFEFTKDKKAISKIIRKREGRLENVLLYGKTTIEPFYELFLLVDNTRNPGKYFKRRAFVQDTMIAKHRVQLITKAIGADTSIYKIDGQSIFQSIQLGSNYRKEVTTMHTVLERFYDSNKFLEAYEDIKDWAPYDKDEEWFQLQLKLTFASFLTNHPEYPGLLKRFQPKAQDSITLTVQQHILTETKTMEAIESNAKKSKLVMINENHFMPEHRIFINKLLPSLRAMGFKYLALEALYEGYDSILNKSTGYPTLETGFYTREQNYANLIRTAKKLGFHFVSYENTNNSIDREEGQASNLYKKTFAKDADARVLVVAGIDHILEEPTNEGKQWLASIMKSKYGIDPLTISQTHLNTYKDLSKEALSMIVSSSFYSKPYTSIDFHILNNISSGTTTQGNSSFRNNHSYPIQLSLFRMSELKNENDYSNKVPYKAIYLKPSENISLELPDESFLVVETNERGNEVEGARVFEPNK